eukprot:c11570_g2_i1.p1 GENE.c11570_g2_i1~~c11570_g2_i1.p1  ORF type:complete len:524 (+),score=105.48 c11570_g2_i1:181-1752(+)
MTDRLEESVNSNGNGSPNAADQSEHPSPKQLSPIPSTDDLIIQISKTPSSPQMNGMRHNSSFNALIERERLSDMSTRTVYVMVGLPGRGKSFISSKLENFLRWKGQNVRSFNVGSYRRQAVGARESGVSTFFSSSNTHLRDEIAMIALEDLIRWLVTSKTDAVAIFDATNSTRERRQMTLQMCQNAPLPIAVVFIESICTDKEVLDANLHNKVNHSPDFIGQDKTAALSDLRKRIEHYEHVYETIKDDSLSYIQIFNLSSKLLCNKIYGRVNKSVIPALMAWNISTRPIWLVRCASPVGAIGGSSVTPFCVDRNAPLSPEGRAFAQELGDFVRKGVNQWHTHRVASAPASVEKELARLSDGRSAKGIQVKVMTSTLPRAEQTAQLAGFHIEQYSSLNPLDKGTMHSLSMEEIERVHPDWFNEWANKPFTTRFPGGESYQDVVSRLETCLVEMEQQVVPVLVVGHVSGLQVLMAYFNKTPVHEMHHIRVPMNTVIQAVPTWAGGWEITLHPLGVCESIPGYKHE